jgi:hypothetical protein
MFPTRLEPLLGVPDGRIITSSLLKSVDTRLSRGGRAKRRHSLWLTEYRQHVGAFKNMTEGIGARDKRVIRRSAIPPNPCGRG